MDDLEAPVPVHPSPWMLNVETLSVTDLEAYLLRLEAEITRVRAVIIARQGVRRSADAMFKL